MIWAPLSKIIDVMGLFLDFQFYSIMYMSILMPVPQCFDCSNFVLLFQDCFWLFGVPYISTGILGCVYISEKGRKEGWEGRREGGREEGKAVEILIGTALNL